MLMICILKWVSIDDDSYVSIDIDGGISDKICSIDKVLMVIADVGGMGNNNV